MKDTSNHTINSIDASQKNHLSLLFSIYSLTSSQLHSSLNILTSITIVANSALAFAAISRGWIGIFSSSICIFILSIILYSFASYSNLKLKNYTVYIIKNDLFEFNKFINKFEKMSNIFLISILLSVILSVIFFILIDIVIAERLLIL